MANIVLTIVIGVIAFFIYTKVIRFRRKIFIEKYAFGKNILKKLVSTYPHLSESDAHMVIDGLRKYFIICNTANLKMISMPSQVIDVAWHEFILCTREYKQFCGKSFGKFLHHTPAEAMKSRTSAQDGIKRAWKLSCLNEFIEPKNPHRLPLIFAMDTLLNIPDGFKYELNCDPTRGDTYSDPIVYCGGHIGCGGGCGGDGGGDVDGGDWGGDILD